MREKNDYVLSLYDGFFDTQEVVLKEIDGAVIEQAMYLRAAFGLKTADAIHAATAPGERRRVLDDRPRFFAVCGPGHSVVRRRMSGLDAAQESVATVCRSRSQPRLRPFSSAS